MTGDDLGITDEDRDLLRRVAEEGVQSVFPPSPPDIDDPAEKPPGSINRVPMEMSREMVDFATETSNAEAAVEYGVSERTVERHRSYWTDGDDAGTISFSAPPEIDDRLCGAMRCAARDGDTLGEIADRHGVAKATVQHHVSENTAQPCDHGVDVTVPRVQMQPGGLHGDVTRSEDGRFASGDD